MSIKSQISKLKENWLLIVVLLVVLAFFTYFKSPVVPLPSFMNMPYAQPGVETFGKAEIADASYARGFISPIPEQDFAPGVQERKITKTASISNEVERGSFDEAEQELKSIVKSSKSFILNENVNKIGKDRLSYYTGGYQIRTEARVFDDVILQLKKIGKVASFNSNALDVTGTFANLEDQLEAEKTRLARYKELYNQATKISDKIELEDRIFNQERTIKYLEDALKNMGEQVEYATVYVTLNEKQSEYIDLVFVKFSDLIKRFISSANSVLLLGFSLLPYAVALLVIMLIVKYFRKKKRRS